MTGKIRWIILSIILAALASLAVVTVWAGPLAQDAQPPNNTETQATALDTSFTYQRRPGDGLFTESAGFSPENHFAQSPLFGQRVTASDVVATPADAAQWAIDTVDTANDFGAYASVAIDPRYDTLYVSYYDATNEDLRLASPVVPGAGNCGPGNGWWCRTVYSTDDVGQYSSIDIWQGLGVWKLGISYYNATDGALEYAEYREYISSWEWISTTIDTGDPSSSLYTGLYTSLKFDSAGTPHIAYHDSRLSEDGIKYTRYVGGGTGDCGGGDWNCDLIEGPILGVGRHASLALNESDEPRIAYYRKNDGALRYAQYLGSLGNCGPDNVWQCDTIDTATGSDVIEGIGPHVSLYVDEGILGETPVIAYYDALNDTLKYANYVGIPHSGNCGPDDTWNCSTIEDVGSSTGAMGVSLDVDSAGAMIAYHDVEDGGVLKVAQPVSRLDLESGNCGPLGGFPLHLTWQCDTVDDGIRGVYTHTVGQYPAVALHAGSLASIAYYDSTNGDMSVAYQEAGTTLTPTIHVLPRAVRPGGQVHVSGYGFSPSGGYYAYVRPALDPDPPSVSDDWVPVTADSDGLIRTTLSLTTTLEAGDYKVVVRTHPIAEPTLIVNADLTVEPAVTLELDPTSGPPGTLVQFSAGNLTPGSLRLDYDGLPLLGPLPLSGSTYSDTFVVPGDRPNPLGLATTVKAVNLASGSPIGVAEVAFESQPSLPSPTYVFTNVVLPTGRLTPGEQFTITGQIVPPPGSSAGRYATERLGSLAAAPAEQYDVMATWYDDEGQAVMISDGPADIQPDGTFNLMAHVPSRLEGDPWTASEQNELRLTLKAPRTGEELAVSHELLFQGTISFTLAVRVFDDITDDLISGAVVHKTSLLVTQVQEPPIKAFDLKVHAHVTQLRPDEEEELSTSYYVQAALNGDNPTMGVTDDSGYWVSSLNPVDPIANPARDQLAQESYYGQAMYAARGSVGTRRQGDTALYPQWMPPQDELWVKYLITVDALLAGYGLRDANGDPQPEFYRKEVWFNPHTGELTHDDGSPMAHLLLVPMASLDPEDVPFSGTAIELEGEYEGLGSLPGVSGEWPIYGGYYSFAPVRGDVFFGVLSHQESVSFDVYHPLAAEIESANLFLDSVLLGPLDHYHLGSAPDVEHFGRDLLFNDYAYLSASLAVNPHQLKVEIHYKAGATSTRYAGLRVESLPAWFTGDGYGNRKASNAPYHPYLEGELAPDGSVLVADVPYSGEQNNQATMGGRMYQHLGSVYSGFRGSAGSEALNTPGTPVPVEGNSASNNPIRIGPEKVTLLQTPMMPVYRSVWGVWPIASAQFGIDIAFAAWVSYDGTVTFDQNGATTQMNITPGANSVVDVFLDVSILELVEASIHGVSDIGMTLPARFTNGAMVDTGKCFWYHLDANWWTKVGCCWCELCKTWTGTEPIFHGQTGDCSSLTHTEAYQSTLASSPPLEANPALATDGYGNTQALYMTEDGELVSRTYNGGLSWTEPTTITPPSQAPSGWQIVDFGPNRALAAWSASDWTKEQWLSPTLTISDAFKSRYIGYATWDGIAWSSPMSLTQPTTGESQVALGACPIGSSGCPAGGAVTAVWVRDVGGDLTQRQFRLYYATYENGAWSTPQPVDPASTATDMQPVVAYVGDPSSGLDLVPLVAWVRDADRDLATLSDRQIAMRRLEPSGSVEVPSTLPYGVIEISLGMDSSGDPMLAFTRIEEYAPGKFSGLLDNRHVLYAAKQTTASVKSPTAGSQATWQAQALRDSHGRMIRAERPNLTIDGEGRGTITFRGLGYGPMADGTYVTFPEDTWGMTVGAGEPQWVEVAFDGKPHDPVSVYQVEVGETYLSPEAIYDPVSDSTIMMATQWTAGASLRQQAQSARSVARVQTVANDAAVVFAAVPRLPDFNAITMTVSSRYPLAGEKISVEVKVRNDGVAWQGSVTDTLNVLATWDGGPGVGSVAGTAQLTALNAGVPLTVTFAVTAPASSHVLHTLFVTVNPTQTVMETDGTNNSLSAVVGGLRPPSDVIALAETGSPLVFLQWPDVDDPRIAGYRIYRATDDEPPMPVGGTLVTGFVDLTSELDHTYYYTVTSYMTTGVESGPSNVVEVTLGSRRTYLPLVLKGFSSSGIQQCKVSLALPERSLIRRREVR
jgi:hypothetical protein